MAAAGTGDLGRRVWEESRKLWVIVAPAIFSRVVTYSMNVITQAFAGHLGDLELAAFSIAATVVAGFNFGFLVRSTHTRITLPACSCRFNLTHAFSVLVTVRLIITSSPITIHHTCMGTSVPLCSPFVPGGRGQADHAKTACCR